MNKFIRSSRPYFPKEDIEQILSDTAASLEEGRLRNGKNLQTLETKFADYIGVKHALALDSDSSALETILRYYGVKGHEVVVCTNSFISIPNSVMYAGGRVIFADIREDTLSMDPDSLRQNISENTCGVIVTHIAGFPNPSLKEIMEICKTKDLFLIEDATHAAGAIINDRKVGTFGNTSVFAFTPTKVITTGEGGMLVTNDPDLAEDARRFSYYGSGPGKTNFVNLGRHMMLPELSAILGIHQLRRIEEFIARRNEIAKIYNDALENTEHARAIKCASRSRSSYYKYPLILGQKIDRQEFTQSLAKEFGVETGNVFYPPCHLQPVYKKLPVSTSKESLLTSERVLQRTITLPMHVALTDEDAEYVADCVLSLLARHAST